MKVEQLLDILKNNKISKIKAKIRFEDNIVSIYDLSVCSKYYGGFKNKILEFKIKKENSYLITNIEETINCCEKSLWDSCEVMINSSYYEDVSLYEVKGFSILENSLYLYCEIK